MKNIDVQKLNCYQHSGAAHPFTCGSGNRTDVTHVDGEGVLLATAQGWMCPFCDYQQPYREFEQTISSGSLLNPVLQQREIERLQTELAQLKQMVDAADRIVRIKRWRMRRENKTWLLYVHDTDYTNNERVIGQFDSPIEAFTAINGGTK